jgi:hypothetical protein
LAIQKTSIDPGNVPGGLFWTIPVAADSVSINLGEGSASLELSNVELKDFGDFCSDLKHGPSVPATASLKVRWNGVTNRVKVRNAAEGFAGQFLITNASMEFTTSVPGNNFEFVSDPAAASTNLFAQIGREHNGVFFPGAG